MKIKPKKRDNTITKREKSIIECIASGYTSEEIAKELKLGLSTINMCLYDLYKRTETVGRAHLVAWAYQHGIL